MDYRLLRIFVSSRMKELAEERRHIKVELEGIRINAWIYEDDAGARPGTIEETYLDELETADLYLGSSGAISAPTRSRNTTTRKNAARTA